ncbi:MAG: D-aminoacyl-tRNA deacylase [Bacillota bacterium]
MRAVVQRVARAEVTVAGEVVGSCGRGLLVLVGVGKEDGPADAAYLAEKTLGLRIFPDDQGKMNLSVADSGGGMLAVSQFTLYGDTRRGRRPGFDGAAGPELAVPLFEAYVRALAASGLKVGIGRFGAMMQVELVNDGPVTILLDSKRGF